MRNSLCSALIATTLAIAHVSAAARGLAWGADDSWSDKLDKGLVTWYHHWQAAPVAQLKSMEYVPMYWGPKYQSLWDQRVASFKSSLPKNILSFNEPDIKSQANLSPADAARLHISSLEPYRQQGVRVSSPQIVWNFDWMDSFMQQIHAHGSDVDYIALHWYGAYNDFAGAKAYVTKAYQKYGKNIWLTELGNTASFGGSAADVRHFMTTFLAWLDQQPYVERVAYTGCFSYTDPPDTFLSNFGGFFNRNGGLRLIGRLYACNSSTC